MIARAALPVLPVLPAFLALLLPQAAVATSLACSFTTLCSPLTDCQDHPGVAFAFDVTPDGLSLDTAAGPVIGTALSHLSSPAFGALFALTGDSTLMLTVAGDGAAVMTQTDLQPPGGLRSISYFGTCAPGT